MILFVVTLVNHYLVSLFFRNLTLPEYLMMKTAQEDAIWQCCKRTWILLFSMAFLNKQIQSESFTSPVKTGSKLNAIMENLACMRRDFSF